MNKILRKALTAATVVLAISTPRSFAQACDQCSGGSGAPCRFTAAMQVIKMSCVGCHSGFPVGNEQTWVQQGCLVPNPPVCVVPGQPTNSPLWNSLQGNGGTMPLLAPPLSGPDLQAIGDWITNIGLATVTVVPNIGGTVSGGGKFAIGSIHNIVATANPGWTFLGWNDGNPAPSRNITVPSCDVTYTASFQAQAAVGSSLANASTRLLVQTGSKIGIAGFIIAGQPQTVLIRGLGPALSQFGVGGVLPNPVLLLFNAAGQMIASNDDWVNTVVDGTIITGDQVAEIQSSGFAPSSNFESVIIATLPPGNYTAQLKDFNNATGVALIEVYSLPQNSSTNLSNLSTRGLVQTGDDVMIGGFIIAGQSQRIVIRALGSTLSRFGVQGVLANPRLVLFNAAGQAIASNDNWQTTVIDGTIITGNQAAEIQSLGFAPSFGTESVIIATLPPGNYTAHLLGVNNSIGVALVEIYALP